MQNARLDKPQAGIKIARRNINNLRYADNTTLIAESESESEVTQSPLSIGFSRQEYWSGLPFPSPGYLPNPGIEPGSPALQAEALSSEPPGKPKNNV